MNCSHVAYDYLSNSLSPGFVSEPKGLDGLITYLMQVCLENILVPSISATMSVRNVLPQ